MALHCGQEFRQLRDSRYVGRVMYLVSGRSAEKLTAEDHIRDETFYLFLPWALRYPAIQDAVVDKSFTEISALSVALNAGWVFLTRCERIND